MMTSLALGLLAMSAATLAQTKATTTPDPLVVTDMGPATSDPQVVTDISPRRRPDRQPEEMPDPVNFCYFEGKAYSEGAIYAGRICSTNAVKQAATAGRAVSHLLWIPAGHR